MPKRKTSKSKQATKRADKKLAVFEFFKRNYSVIAGFLAKITPKWLQNFLALWVPIFLLLSLQPLTDFARDKTQISLLDLSIPLILALLTSFLIALIVYWPFTKNRFVALILAVGIYFAIQTRVDMKLQPLWDLLRSSNFVSKIIDFLGSFNLIIFDILFILIVYFLFIKTEKVIRAKKINLDNFYRGSVIAISVAFSIQFFSVLKIAIIEWPQFFYRPSEFAQEGINENPELKPDIYYIVLDRYTNQNVLREQLGFDNSGFIGSLKDNGFFVNEDAYGNYPNTASSVSSTLKANYHSDLTRLFSSSSLQTYAPFFNSSYYSPVIGALKKIGYKYYNLGSYYEISNQAPLADYDYKSGSHLNILGRIYPLSTFETKEIKNSVYRGIIKKGIKIGNFSVVSYGGLNQKDQSLFSVNKLKELADEPAGGRFIFSHILVPHNPYYFNADGSFSKTPWVNNDGKSIGEKYIGQIEFINSQMKELVDKIKKKDDQAVIIIQSDEGPYPSQEKMPASGTLVADPEMDQSNKTQQSREDLQMKYGVLAAYHAPKISSEEFNAYGNSVNIFRLILNNYFGFNLHYLPDCQYGFGRNTFNFTDITEKVTGEKNNYCSRDSLF